MPLPGKADNGADIEVEILAGQTVPVVAQMPCRSVSKTVIPQLPALPAAQRDLCPWRARSIIVRRSMPYLRFC